MKLVLLGTTGYHANDRRQTACVMLPESGVVFDAGTGFYRTAEYLQTDTLDVFLSHAHLQPSPAFLAINCCSHRLAANNSSKPTPLRGAA